MKNVKIYNEKKSNLLKGSLYILFYRIRKFKDSDDFFIWNVYLVYKRENACHSMPLVRGNIW